MCARAFYRGCAHVYARILMKFDTYSHKIVIDHHIKFHEDPGLATIPLHVKVVITGIQEED